MNLVKERLSNPLFPGTKTWMYLCNAVIASDVDRYGVLGLLMQYEKSDVGIVARAAKQLREKFF